MVLHKLDELYPNYPDEIFDGYNIKNFHVYAENDRVGLVDNLLIDEKEGRFRYFIVDTGFWILGKKVLLPVGLTRMDHSNKHIYVPELTKQQVKDLPEFSEDLAIDHDYEERVRSIYRPLVPASAQQLEYTAAFNYQYEPYFYEMNDPDFKVYEKRILAKEKHRI